MSAAESVAHSLSASQHLIRQTIKVQSVCQTLLWLAISLYVFLVLRLTFYLHDSVFGFQSGWDLAIFDQAAWLISQGQTPFVTVRGLHILADHFSVILYLLAPLYWIWDSPKSLLVAQTVALALGTLPIYALARERTGSALTGLVFAVCYLLYPIMQWSNTYEFHPDTFATPLLLAAFLYLTRERWLWYFAMLGLAVLTKESAGLIVMALGVYVLFKVNRRIGWLTLGFGLLTLVVALGTVRFFNEGTESGYYLLYGKYGDSVPAIAGYLLTHPLEVFADLNTATKREYLLHLLQPLMFLPLLAPELLLVAIPGLLTNLLSSRGVMHTLHGGYYAATITPILFVSALTGYDRLRRRIGISGAKVVGVNLCVWSLMGVSQSALWRQYHELYSRSAATQTEEKQRAAETLGILAAIPPQASVSAQITLTSHLSHRRHLYTFPNPFLQRGWGNTVQARRELEFYGGFTPPPAQLERAITDATIEYVVLCPSTMRFPLLNNNFEECALELLKNRSYGIIAIGAYTVLLRRGADHGRGLHLLEERAAVPIVKPQDKEMAFWKWLGNQPSPP